MSPLALVITVAVCGALLAVVAALGLTAAVTGGMPMPVEEPLVSYEQV